MGLGMGKAYEEASQAPRGFSLPTGEETSKKPAHRHEFQQKDKDQTHLAKVYDCESQKLGNHRTNQFG